MLLNCFKIQMSLICVSWSQNLNYYPGAGFFSRSEAHYDLNLLRSELCSLLHL